jgi:hypothetical protein
MEYQADKEVSESEESKQAQKKKADAYIERFTKLAGERSNWETHWQECFDYIVPRKGSITRSDTPGVKMGAELFDTTAIMANQLLAGALHGMLTNPATRFFELVMGDPALDSNEDVKAWLQLVGDRMFILLNNSNFQTEIHEIYLDLGAIGTACLYMGEHPEKIVHFAARNMKEAFIEENNLGLIDTVYRAFEWKPRQVVQEFGLEKLPRWVQEQYAKGCDDDWKIIHVVQPSDDENQAKKNIFPYKSCYILKEQSLILSEGGFREFPYAVPRWTKVSGEKYGRGPGMEMLPDVKMVNKMMETTIQGAQKTVNPPLMVTDDGVIGRVRLTPGGLTVVRAGEAPIKPLIIDARIDFGYQAVEDVRRRIRSGFYVDQLQLSQGPQMTATEVNARTEQQLRLMGPVLGRQHFEFLRPVIGRLFPIMMRRGLLPPAPKVIQGKAFDVRYSSLVARAQRMSEGQNMARAISVAAPLMQMDPNAQDVVNADEAVRHILDVYGVPTSIYRKKKEVDDRRKARADAQAKAVQQQQEAHIADVASKVMPGAAQMQQAQANAPANDTGGGQ